MERRDITIVGGGPVGLFGAFYAGLRGMSVRIIDSLPQLGGQLTALYPEKDVFDMPGFPQVRAKDLADRMAEQAMRFSPELVLEETAAALDDDGEGMTIRTASGLALPTRRVLITAGAGAFTPTRLGVEREEELAGRGLSYGVRSLAAYAGRRVAVVGGGDSALDWAVHLQPIAASVEVIHRRDQFRAHEETVREAQALGIPFRLWRTVQELKGGDRLEGAVLVDPRSGELEEIECDDLVVNIGFKSSLGPIKEWGLAIEKNQIAVDDRYRTSRPGVFAAGDVCTHDAKVKLIATGVGEAATAVCVIKTELDPQAKLFPGHSSDMNLG